ncbi:hypothetical protein ACS0TY_033700 [Phlomoides rotata]
MHIASRSTNSSSMNTEQGEIPIAEALRCQIEVQKRLQEQIEVQKKLQMRIESQGTHRLQLGAIKFYANGDDKNGNVTDYGKAHESNYIKEAEETKDMIKLKIEGPSVEFDLNSRSSYDFFGINGSIKRLCSLQEPFCFIITQLASEHNITTNEHQVLAVCKFYVA